MTSLPTSRSLPIEFLSASFRNTTTTYKFYWFLAIIDHVKTYRTSIMLVDDLKSTMISRIWYPAVYFKVSFGKQDRLGSAAMLLNTLATTELNTNQSVLIEAISLLRKTSKEFAKEFNDLGRYVPYRFLEPFFTDELRGLPDHRKNTQIVEFAQQSFVQSNQPTLYRFLHGREKKIEIHPEWYLYLQQHLTILEEYCLWNLLTYLQRRNPNIPNIAGKLFPPQLRNLDKAKQFWKQVLQKKGEIHCIYSGGVIPAGELSLDHFLPWRYVTHDLLWNLVPTLRSVNSSKQDYLPDLAKYFNEFSQIQFDAVQLVAAYKSNLKLIEDYIILLGCEKQSDLIQIPYDAFRDKLYETLAPQLQIARSMGFIGNWSYTPDDLSISTEP